MTGLSLSPTEDFTALQSLTKVLKSIVTAKKAGPRLVQLWRHSIGDVNSTDDDCYDTILRI